MAQSVKNPPAMQETPVRFLGQEDPLEKGIATHSSILGGFPGGSDGKESACSAGDPGLIPGSGRSPGERNVNTLQYSCLENQSHGQRSLEGCGPWGHRVGHN